MNEPARIALRFSDEISSIVRLRISYAFRVFAAIYNYRVVPDGAVSDDATVFYGGSFPNEENKCKRWIHARYRPRPLEEAPAVTKRRYAGEIVPAFHGFDVATGQPDWLGEIFEWLSSGLERSIGERDSVGRIASWERVFKRYEISERTPYATIMMAWLQNYLKSSQDGEALPKAESPVSDVRHFVICSHDIDFYWNGRTALLRRLLKNLGISCLLYRNTSFFASNARMLASAIAGGRSGDFLPPLVEAGREGNFQSTLFAIVNHAHRRDANYSISQIAPRLNSAREAGFAVGLHGSYNSIIENRDLSKEVETLAVTSGVKPSGSRQHWLRFDSHDHLFETVENAKLKYDTTLGFPDAPGFRNGASFAFPPYDFQKERAYDFLEIPLVLMDGNIEAAARRSKEKAGDIVAEVLQNSRKWGWGGISALWHNPIEPLHIPEEINGIFWECLKEKSHHEEMWTSAEKFLARCLGRYKNAGLLESVRLDA